MSNFVSYANATDLMTAIGQKFAALEGAYVIRGSVTFANLPSTLTGTMVGYVYNVSDQFTTDARFVEGAGKTYAAGTNVVVIDAGTQGSPDYKFDVIGSFVDVDGIYTEIDKVAEMVCAVPFDAGDAYEIGDVVVYQRSLYQFTSAHTADDPWDATEVRKVDVLDLIASAEPESLTTSQVNALLALLQ